MENKWGAGIHYLFVFAWPENRVNAEGAIRNAGKRRRRFLEGFCPVQRIITPMLAPAVPAVRTEKRAY